MMTSHARHGSSSHRQLDNFFNGSFTRKTLKHAHYWSFVSGINRWTVNSLYKRPAMLKMGSMSWYDVITHFTNVVACWAVCRLCRAVRVPTFTVPVALQPGIMFLITRPYIRQIRPAISKNLALHFSEMCRFTNFLTKDPWTWICRRKIMREFCWWTLELTSERFVIFGR